jgi:trehalose 6-phosphate synthase/phosphatase
MKLIIIANRLPVKIEKKNNKLRITKSEGGLSTGMGSLELNVEKHWIGWPGIYTDSEEEKAKITKRLKKFNYHPVFLSAEQIENYYEGYSNSVIWPLCHYFFSFVQYKTEFWETYQEVNTQFCEAAVPFIEDDDLVWVHDYHLMLLPKMIRNIHPTVNIGYFHHIPFPPYELFRVLPEREELLNGLLGADLIGFHVHDYMRHFLSAIYRVLDLNCQLDEIYLEDRIVHVDAFPMGINYEQYHNASSLPAVQKIVNKLKHKLGRQSIILSVDRLDYSKGILHRLKGFALFLKNHPEYHEKVSLMMIVVPSRSEVHKYADLKTEIDQLIGEINGLYSKPGWTPVHYFYRSFAFNELIAMYNLANIALVTPLRDGMNLVAKEYLAAKSEENPGVLILSEMAGSAAELTEAIIINPNNIKDIETAILQALSMSEEEKKERLLKMQKHISRQTVKKWANDFIDEMQLIQRQNREISTKIIEQEQFDQIKQKYNNASSRLLLLDYDGTLAPFTKNPKDAVPSQQLIDLLNRIKEDKRNTVVINSGRNYKILDKWFNHIDIDLTAEHGAFYRENGVWHANYKKIEKWDDEIMHILHHAIEKTPRSSLEIKNTSLVWHYRQVDAWLAELRQKQLMNALIEPCSRLNLQIVPGNKILEIKPATFNKGTEVKRRLAQKNYDFIMAIGDDTTDEDMFRALPSDGISIKVGSFSPTAKYRIPLQSKVIPFLKKLIS